MDNLMFSLDEFITVLMAVLFAIQAIINYLLPPEKAEKYNVIGKILDFLSKTKAGLSPKIDDRISK